MCDYSLEMYKSRPAVEGEVLSLRKFPSGTKGFTNADKECAVCIKEGATLSLDTPDGTCHFGVFTSSLATGFAHRDGIITNGAAINLQFLPEGTLATVHLPATDAESDAKVEGATLEADTVSVEPIVSYI